MSERERSKDSIFILPNTWVNRNTMPTEVMNVPSTFVKKLNPNCTFASVCGPLLVTTAVPMSTKMAGTIKHPATSRMGDIVGVSVCFIKQQQIECE